MYIFSMIIKNITFAALIVKFVLIRISDGSPPSSSDVDRVKILFLTGSQQSCPDIKPFTKHR